MRRESVFSSIALFVLVLIASDSVHSQSEPRLDDVTNLGSNLDGSTITVTPSSSYDVYCYRQNVQKDWYKINGGMATYVRRNSGPTHGSNVYVRRISESGTETLALHFKPFQSKDIGEYKCKITPTNGPTATLSIYLTTPPTTTPTPTPPPTPMPPSKVQSVTVTKTVQGSSPALRVSWSAVSGSGITYTVCYSTTDGTQSDPPSDANCGTSGITGTSTTLGPLSIGTTYYIWVAAVSSGGRGAYSDRRQERTYQDAPAPEGLSVSPLEQTGRLRVDWDVPRIENELPIRGFNLNYTEITSNPTHSTIYVHAPIVRNRGIRAWWYSDSREKSFSMTHTISGLQLGTSYSVRVAAVTQLGTGVYSDSVTSTTYNVPEQVKDVEYRVNINDCEELINIIVTWSRPSSDVAISRYEVQYDDSGVPQPTLVAKGQHQLQARIVINGTDGSSYRIAVRAVSAIGSGAWSRDVKTGVPLKPANISYVASANTFFVEWMATGPEATYRIHTWRMGSPQTATFKPVTPPYNITGLESNTEYTVVIEAYNSLGSANGSVVGYTLPEDPKRQTEIKDSSARLSLPLGLFIAGLMSGIMLTLIVVGTIWCICKVSQSRSTEKHESSAAEESKRQVAQDNIEMTDCPAYQSAEAGSNDNRDPVNDDEENAYELVGCDDIQGKNEDLYA